MPASVAVLPPPMPGVGMEEVARVNHTRLRRRLIYSEHEGDIDDRLYKNIPNVRKAAWGQIDTTANPYLSMWSQAATLYDAEPELLVPAGSEPLAELVAETGFWPLMQRVQRDCLALREMLIRVDITDEGELSFRPVFPDMVSLSCHPRRPSVPARVREWVADDAFGYVLHDLDIRNPEAPTYRVWTDAGAEVTGDVLGRSYSGEKYPYRDSADRPFLPYPLYHAAATGTLFDPFTYREVVEGSLNIGVLLTFYGHLVRNAAWAQRYCVNLEPVGADIVTPNGAGSERRDVVTDPAVLLQLQQIPGQGQPMVGQWSAPGDPEAVLRSINMYERRVQLIAGFAPPDVTRQEADIRSGYSLAVDREALRARQRVFLPQFRRGDQEVLRVAACLHNRVLSTAYSERALDYRPVYQGLPESPAEVSARLAQVKTRQDMGQIGPVSALREAEPELTYDEAVLRLAEVGIEKADVDIAAKGLLASRGIVAAPPAVDVEVGKIVALAGLLERAQAGAVPVDSVRELGIAMGVPADRMVAIVAAIKPAPTAEAA